jgi:hypothetical protein
VCARIGQQNRVAVREKHSGIPSHALAIVSHAVQQDHSGAIGLPRRGEPRAKNRSIRRRKLNILNRHAQHRRRPRIKRTPRRAQREFGQQRSRDARCQ